MAAQILHKTMENGTGSQGEGRDPSGFLSEIIGSQVTVKLNSGVVYKGRFFALGYTRNSLMLFPQESFSPWMVT